MLFAIGTRVKLRFTDETGVVTARLDDTLLQIRLDNDPDEIPVFEEDLVRDAGAEPRVAGAKFMPGKIEKQPEPPPRREIKSQYVILKPKGLQLAFEPMPGRDGSVSRFKIWLLNDAADDYVVEFDLFVGDRCELSSDEKIGANSAIELGDLLLDRLNESPEVEIFARRVATDGLDEGQSRVLKLKPKQFFANAQTAPILNVMTHLYVIFDKPAEKPNSGTDLKTYTQQQMRANSGRQNRAQQATNRPFRMFNVEEFAEFESEIDLHIEKLTGSHAKMNNAEILHLQLRTCDRFLEKAIRLGVSKVYLIHGVGEGKLRDAIAAQLRRNPYVRDYKNEFHKKYGYGATEVMLG